jgi:hypothetical protein
MTEQLFQISIEDVIVNRVLPAEMLQDLHVIAGLSEEECRQIGGALRSLEGLATGDAIKNAVEACLSEDDEGKTESVVNALSSLKPQAIPRLMESIKAWASAKKPRQEVFSDSVLERLGENLHVLISDYHAVALMQKAEQLLRDVGNEFQGVKFVCDLRPVFDEQRANVEGFVLLANMRLIYVSQDGHRHVCEIAFTEEELQQLRNDVDKAQSKLEVLKEVRSTLTVNSCNKETGE